MMEIRVPKDLLISQREASAMYAPKYRRDRQDQYFRFSDRLDIFDASIVVIYICVEVNCNPDFDW